MRSGAASASIAGVARTSRPTAARAMASRSRAPSPCDSTHGESRSSRRRSRIRCRSRTTVDQARTSSTASSSSSAGMIAADGTIAAGASSPAGPASARRPPSKPISTSSTRRSSTVARSHSAARASRRGARSVGSRRSSKWRSGSPGGSPAVGSRDVHGAAAIRSGTGGREVVPGELPDEDHRSGRRPRGETGGRRRELGDRRDLFAARGRLAGDGDRVDVGSEGGPGEPDRSVLIQARAAGLPPGQPGDGLDGRPVANGRRQDRQDGRRRGAGDETRDRGRRPGLEAEPVGDLRIRCAEAVHEVPGEVVVGHAGGQRHGAEQPAPVAEAPDHRAGRRGGAEIEGQDDAWVDGHGSMLAEAVRRTCRGRDEDRGSADAATHQGGHPVARGSGAAAPADRDAGRYRARGSARLRRRAGRPRRTPRAGR